VPTGLAAALTLDQSWSSSGAHEAESPVDVVQLEPVRIELGSLVQPQPRQHFLALVLEAQLGSGRPSPASSLSAAAWLWMLPGGQDPIDGGSDLLAGDRTGRAGHQ